jgi:hypothetical protein
MAQNLLGRHRRVSRLVFILVTLYLGLTALPSSATTYQLGEIQRPRMQESRR